MSIHTSDPWGRIITKLYVTASKIPSKSCRDPCMLPWSLSLSVSLEMCSQAITELCMETSPTLPWFNFTTMSTRMLPSSTAAAKTQHAQSSWSTEPWWQCIREEASLCLHIEIQAHKLVAMERTSNKLSFDSDETKAVAP